jgi:hypothetical protein
MSRASGSDRASRSSFVTTSVSPLRHAASASRRPRTIAIGPGQAVIDVGALDADAKSRQRIALRGEVLIVS